MKPSRLNTVATVAVFGLIVAGVVWSGRQPANVAVDQNLFHLVAIRQFAAQWPHPDLHNYPSATSPGYHLLLAAVSRYVSDDVRVLRCVGGVFGVAFIAVLAWAANRRTGRSACLTLIAASSYYVLNSTAWLLPDDAAWVLVAIGLMLAMWADGRRLFRGMAVLLPALIFVRQSHAWMLLPLAAAAYSLSRYAGGRRGRGSCYSPIDHNLADPLPNPLPAYQERGPDALVCGVLAALPAMAVLAWLVWLWHGLTPPAFRVGTGIDLPLATKVGGLAPAAPAMTLALLGLFGTPLLAWLWPVMKRDKIVRVALFGMAAGFILGVLPNTAYEPLTKRSGLWNVVLKLPMIGNHSLLMIGLSTLGGAVAALALARLPRRERLVLAAALAGFVAAQMANATVWQRYYEPFVLIWLILAAATPTAQSDAPNSRYLRIAGVVAVTAFQLCVTIYGLHGGGG